MITANPLQWPVGKTRTLRPQRSTLRASFVKNRDGLLAELRLLGATNVVISSNLSLRGDGLPYANQRQPDDRGIAVYFKLNGDDECMACDRWTTVEENLRALELTVAALRGIERWGGKDMVHAAFRGFKALPETIVTAPPSREWYDVLQVNPNASREVLEAAYKRLARMRHPDAGGSEEEMKELNIAYQKAKEVR